MTSLLCNPRQMMVELSEQVVILDEAHNMEDSAREAASVSITCVQITDVVDEVEEICGSLQGLLCECSVVYNQYAVVCK